MAAMSNDSPAPNGLSPRPLEHLVRPVAPARLSDRLGEVANRIVEENGGLPVVDEDGKLAGFISERDLVAALFPTYLQQIHHTGFLTRDFDSLVRRAAEASQRPVEDYMTREQEPLHVDDSESHAAEVFLHHTQRSLPVVDASDHVRGVVHMADVVQSLLMACGQGSGDC